MPPTLVYCCDDPDCPLCEGESVVWDDLALTLADAPALTPEDSMTRLAIVLYWHSPDLVTGLPARRACYWCQRGTAADVARAQTHADSRVSTGMRVRTFDRLRDADAFVAAWRSGTIQPPVPF